MKIRNGFVSNSSSSSFVIKENVYPTLFDLAREMLKIRDTTWLGCTDQVDFLDKYEKDGMHPDSAICFNSTNYDTYIFKQDGYYWVNTCNNHTWKNIKGREYYYPPDDDGYLAEKIDEVQRNHTFLYLHTRIIAKPAKTYFSCNKKGHFGNGINIDGKDMCPQCFLEELENENT